MELVRPVLVVVSENVEHCGVTEEQFLLLYERTARPLRAYLYRMLADVSKADDILQETYLRFLQARLPINMTEEHGKNYLFRIATNLLHDELGSRKDAPLVDYPSASDVGEEVRQQNDCASYLKQLPSRQRKLLWLAYAEGFSHKEIAELLGVRAPSIRPMLARARRRFSEILRSGGFRDQ